MKIKNFDSWALSSPPDDGADLSGNCCKYCGHEIDEDADIDYEFDWDGNRKYVIVWHELCRKLEAR